MTDAGISEGVSCEARLDSFLEATRIVGLRAEAPESTEEEQERLRALGYVN